MLNDHYKTLIQVCRYHEGPSFWTVTHPILSFSQLLLPIPSKRTKPGHGPETTKTGRPLVLFGLNVLDMFFSDRFRPRPARLRTCEGPGHFASPTLGFPITLFLDPFCQRSSGLAAKTQVVRGPGPYRSHRQRQGAPSCSGSCRVGRSAARF